MQTSATDANQCIPPYHIVLYKCLCVLYVVYNTMIYTLMRLIVYSYVLYTLFLFFLRMGLWPIWAADVQKPGVDRCGAAAAGGDGAVTKIPQYQRLTPACSILLKRSLAFGVCQFCNNFHSKFRANLLTCQVPGTAYEHKL